MRSLRRCGRPLLAAIEDAVEAFRLAQDKSKGV
jgi:hypothetical protein